MINFMSSWAEQIILAVIIATIIEMILPKNKNQKYIQMVIGIYVLFNIISPIMKSKEFFSIEKYDSENYQTKSYTSDIITKDLKKRGMKFVGSVTIYSYLEAIGIIDNHTTECYLY